VVVVDVKAFRGDEFLDKMVRIGRCLETLERITQQATEEQPCCGNCEHWMPNHTPERLDRGCCDLDYDDFVEARIVPPEWKREFWCEMWKARESYNGNREAF